MTVIFKFLGFVGGNNCFKISIAKFGQFVHIFGKVLGFILLLRIFESGKFGKKFPGPFYQLIPMEI